jgi:processive 1,2-diacylglycerol beta-glucosyltransferase
MKKILIFTLPTGNGHNQVATVLKDMLSSEDIEIKIINPLDESNIFIKTIIQKGYLFTASKTPFIYSNLYKFSNQNKIPSTLIDFYSKKIYYALLKEIQSEKPQMVISTHPLLNQSLSNIKETNIFSFVSVITDYKAHKIYLADNVDIYLTGSQETKEDILKKGVPSYKVYSYGIPISEKFFFSKKAYYNCSKIDRPLNVLIMGGSLGMGLKKNHLLKILKNTPNFKYTIVCGTNDKLKFKLQTLIRKYNFKNITLWGFTNKIPEIMESSDLIITKPGGITITEAIIKNLPIIIPYTIPGQEEENAAFIEKNNFGISAYSTKELIKLLNHFNENRNELKLIKKNMSDFSKSYSLENTKILLTSFLDTKKIKHQSQESSLDFGACG